MVESRLATAEDHKSAGNAAFKAGQYVKAIASYGLAITKSNGRIPLYYTNRATARLKLWQADDHTEAALAIAQDTLDDCEHALACLDDRERERATAQAGDGAKTGRIAGIAIDAATKEDEAKAFLKANWLMGRVLRRLDRPHSAYAAFAKAYRAAVRQGSINAAEILEGLLEARRLKWQAAEKVRIAEEATLANRLTALVMQEHDRRLAAATTVSERDEAFQERDDTLAGLAALLSRSEDRAKVRDVPDGYICPISLQIMTDPVVSRSGRSFDRTAILHHLTYQPFDPLTREPMLARNLYDNIALRDTIEDFLQHNGWAADY